MLDRLRERTRQAISEAQAEISIAWVQLAIVAASTLVYGLAPQAIMRSEPHLEPLPWVLADAALLQFRDRAAARSQLAFWRGVARLANSKDCRRFAESLDELAKATDRAKPASFVCGNDRSAKRIVSALVELLGAEAPKYKV